MSTIIACLRMVSFQTILYSLLLLQCLLLGAFLIREQRLIVLRIFLFVLASHMGLNLIEAGLSLDITSFIGPVLSQLYGPLLFLFFVELMYADFRLQWGYTVHLLPAGVALVLMAVYGRTNLIVVLTSMTFLFYITFACLKVLRFRRDIKETYADPWGTRFGWVVVILMGFVAVGILDSLSRTVVSPGSLSSIALQTTSLALLLTTLTAMVWKAMNQPRVLVAADMPTIRKPGVQAEGPSADVEVFKGDIESLFASRHMQLKLRLSVADVAKLLELPPRDVSKLVNQGFEMSFSDYVNGKRIETAIDLMKNPDHKDRSLLQIAFDSGFNSKTAFHESFRKKMNSTPSAWRKKNDALLAPEE